MKKLLSLLIIAMCFLNCSQQNKTEKHQGKRNNIVNVHDKVKAIDTEPAIIGRYARPYIMCEYILIPDGQGFDKVLHIFDRKDFRYVTSAINKGHGPGEITSMGHLGIDEVNRICYITDHGKNFIYSYPLDSLLSNSIYIPEIKMQINKSQQPLRYVYINDTLSMGTVLTPIGNADFNLSVGKWNMNTGEITKMKYKHPDIKKKRVEFDVSMEHGLYVESYDHHDLLTICSLDGELKYNIYGPAWDTQVSNKKRHYGGVAFCGDKIIASYYGGDNFTEQSYPTKFHVFDLEGNYIKTLEIGRMINFFCYDKMYNRLIMNLNDIMQFAYLDLDELLD